MKNQIKKAMLSKRDVLIDYWLSNETFNRVASKAKEVYITKEGILELHFDDGDIFGLKLREQLYYGDSCVAYIKVEYVSDTYKADKARARSCEVF